MYFVYQNISKNQLFRFRSFIGIQEVFFLNLAKFIMTEPIYPRVRWVLSQFKRTWSWKSANQESSIKYEVFMMVSVFFFFGLNDGQCFATMVCRVTCDTEKKELERSW